MKTTTETTDAARKGHTPGPWSYEESSGTIPAGTVPIACTYDNPDDGAEPMGEEPSAYNGHLMKASPDLLAACEAALAYDAAIQRHASKGASWVEGDDLDSLYEKWIEAARAAIAKARHENDPARQ